MHRFKKNDLHSFRFYYFQLEQITVCREHSMMYHYRLRREVVHFSRFSKVVCKLFRCGVHGKNARNTAFALCKIRYKVFIDGLLISHKSRRVVREWTETIHRKLIIEIVT